MTVNPIGKLEKSKRVGVFPVDIWGKEVKEKTLKRTFYFTLRNENFNSF